MQTFLPTPSFSVSAQMLDTKRLGKQRVEALQILNALAGKSKGWVNHPATLMWYGYEEALTFYHDCMVAEWVQRGHRNNMPYLCQHKFAGKGEFRRNQIEYESYPHWWRDDAMISKLTESHRSNLFRKDPEFYSALSLRTTDGRALRNDLPYFWPVTRAEVESKRVLALCT